MCSKREADDSKRMIHLLGNSLRSRPDSGAQKSVSDFCSTGVFDMQVRA